MTIENRLIKEPFFSICIPQYNRTSFLIETLRSLINQTFKNFEVCISDDCSNEGREKDLINFLKQSELCFIYQRQKENRRYDANLRTSIALARGSFCFLLGNDDCLKSPITLFDLHQKLQGLHNVGVAISNYENFKTGKKFRRIKKTKIIGSGPHVAATHFRNFSFIGGILLERRAAQRHTTEKWDGSEMYQMFIGCRIIAEGASLVGIDTVTVRQSVQIEGKTVDSIAARPKIWPCQIVERRIPLNEFARVAVDAVNPFLRSNEKQLIAQKIFSQFLFFTYPFWIFEYRSIQSWNYALGICIGMRPRNIFLQLHLSWFSKIYLTSLYLGATFFGLVIPRKIFNNLQPFLYTIAKNYSYSVKNNFLKNDSILSKVS